MNKRGPLPLATVARLSPYLAACPGKHADCRIALVIKDPLSYSSTIDTGTLKRDCKMSITLRLRALALLAFVALSTAVIIEPELIGGIAAADLETMHSGVAISHP